MFEGLDEVFARGGSPGPSEHEATIRDLHAKIGELTMERDFFQRGFAALSRPARRNLVERDGALSIRRQCALLGISRSSVYYAPRGESAENLALMRRMDALSLQYPFYGSRQMARHLRREGVAAGRRRVRRLLRLMGLEAIYRKPRTSDAQPDHHVYPYLLRELKIDRPDQVWCADITYIPVTTGFLYLVAIMDWASRHVLSWRLYILRSYTTTSGRGDQHDGQQLLRRGAGGGAADGDARHLQHRPGVAVYERGVHRPCPGCGRAVLDGRPRSVPG